MTALFEPLDALLELEEDWNCEGASAISPGAVEIAKAILADCAALTHCDIDAGPLAEGGVCLTLRDGAKYVLLIVRPQAGHSPITAVWRGAMDPGPQKLLLAPHSAAPFAVSRLSP